MWQYQTSLSGYAFEARFIQSPPESFPNWIIWTGYPMNTSSLANCRTVVVLNPEKFRSDFFDWITKNYEIFLRFEIEANKIRAAGRTSYGHRTIWEFIRHETALREADGEFKMNDHYTKNCAQLYLLLHPDAGQFFRFRDGVAPADMARAA